jgi:hypothetical protein
MIQVRMGEQYCVYGRGIESELLVLNSLNRIASLVHATIQKHAPHRHRLKHMTGACYLLGSAQKCECSHGLPPFLPLFIFTQHTGFSK